MSTDVATAQSEVTCLFWNVDGNDRAQLLCDMVSEHAVDVVVIAEPNEDRNTLLTTLQNRVSTSFHEPDSDTVRIQLLARTPELNMTEVQGTASGRMTIRNLNCLETSFLFVAMHLPSKSAHWTEADQAAEVTSLSTILQQEEGRQDHRRTVLVGDLNMNPFETGVMLTRGLHGAMTQQTALKRQRKIEGEEYPYFYNPMWGLFGDRTEGPPGTHYYRGKHVSYDWNIYDQVLIRPDALPWFDDRIEIIERVGDTHLRTRRGRGLPNGKVGSDHLPILFSLREPDSRS